MGQGLADWSDAFQPKVTQAADSLVEALQQSIAETARQLQDHREIMKLEILPDILQQEREDSLLRTLDKEIDMLGKLSGIHSKLTAVSVAAMVAALTRPNIKDLPGDPESFRGNTVRDVTPVRTLGQ